ncbi:MAG: hypothetical protein EOO56_17895 [Hymenobacter sp.]|nr:MAG: hypothetical protein EOO56_17895 [Hymenobacter sp.]
MLYLFGRLALSDSYYFNEDFHADERPESQHRPVPVATPHSATVGGGYELPTQASTKKPVTEFSNGLLVS